LLDTIKRLFGERLLNQSGTQTSVEIIGENSVGFDTFNTGENKILLCPISGVVSAPFNARRLNQSNVEFTEFNQQVSQIINLLEQWLIRNKIISDGDFWNYNISNKIAQIISFRGISGALTPGNGIIGLESELIPAKGYADSLFLTFGGLKLLLARRTIRKHLGEVANGLNGFKSVSSDLDEIVDLLISTSNATRAKNYDRISFLYVDSLIDIEEVPENFINHAIKHVLNSVIGKSRLHSQCLIFGALESEQGKGFGSKHLDGLENQRFMPPFELILSSTNGLTKEGLVELQNKIQHDEIRWENQWYISKFEDTHVDSEPPMFVFTAPVWDGSWSSSREISGEQIIT
jgi:hypothetical protein